MYCFSNKTTVTSDWSHLINQHDVNYLKSNVKIKVAELFSTCDKVVLSTVVEGRDINTAAY